MQALFLQGSFARLLLLCLVCFLCGSLAAPAQVSGKKISIQIKAQDLVSALQQLEKESHIPFAYQVNGLDAYRVKEAAFVEKPVSVILTNLLTGTGLVFEEKKGVIIIRRKLPAPLPGYTLNGRIEDAISGEQLVGVTVTAPYAHVSALTNNYGYFSLTLPADTATLSISHLSYQAKDTVVQVAAGRPITITLLPGAGAMLQTVTVSASRQRIQHTSQMGKISIPVTQIQSMPKFFGEADVLKALQTLPGVQQGTEGTSALIVRGGSPDQNLVLLDGAPLYNPSHLLGVFSSFNTYALKNVELYKGAFPARFGGRLSSVVDIVTKDGDLKKMHGNVSIGTLASTLTLEGPIVKNRTSFIVSGRRTYHDLYLAPLMKSQSPGLEKFSLYFYDLNGKLHHRISDKDQLYLSLYLGKDNLRIKENRTSGQDVLGQDLGLRWGNAMGSLRWNHIFSNRVFANATLIASDYRFRMFRDTKLSGSSNVSTTHIALQSGITDVTAKLDIDYNPQPAHTVKTGISSTWHYFKPGATSNREMLNQTVVKQEVEGNVVPATEMDMYAEDDWKISGKLKVNIGLHASGFGVEGKWYASLQPRLSARYLLPGNWAVKASYARMAQYLHLLASNSVSLPTDLWVPATARVHPQLADQYAMGIARTIFRDQFEFSVEGYYKRMDGIIEYKDGANFIRKDDNSGDWQNKVSAGEGKAYGMECFLQKKNGRFTGWLGYTLAWSTRRFAEVNNGLSFPYKYDRRHTLNMVGVYRIKPGIELSGAWVYQSASPFTIGVGAFEGVAEGANVPGTGQDALEIITSRNNVRVSPQHRLDISCSFIKHKKNGAVRTWNVSVYNVYNHHNSFYFELKGYKVDHAVLNSYSLLPIVPSLSYSLKF